MCRKNWHSNLNYTLYLIISPCFQYHLRPQTFCLWNKRAKACKKQRKWCTYKHLGSAPALPWNCVHPGSTWPAILVRGFPWLQFIWWFAAQKSQEPPRTSKNLQGAREQNWTQNRRRHIAWGASWRDWDRKINFCGIASPRWSECPIFGQPTVATRWGFFFSKPKCFKALGHTGLTV